MPHTEQGLLDRFHGFKRMVFHRLDPFEHAMTGFNPTQEELDHLKTCAQGDVTDIDRQTYASLLRTMVDITIIMSTYPSLIGLARINLSYELSNIPEQELDDLVRKNCQKMLDYWEQPGQNENTTPFPPQNTEVAMIENKPLDLAS